LEKALGAIPSNRQIWKVMLRETLSTNLFGKTVPGKSISTNSIGKPLGAIFQYMGLENISGKSFSTNGFGNPAFRKVNCVKRIWQKLSGQHCVRLRDASLALGSRTARGKPKPISTQWPPTLLRLRRLLLLLL
jgi:hypothetical protein